MHEKNKIPCPICDKLFVRQGHMKRHVHTVHSLGKMTSCPVCFKGYRQDLLSGHVDDCHPPDQKYHCRMCDSETDTFQQLEAHEATHLTLYKHVCEQCNATFKRRDHLNRHIRTQHTTEVVSCKLCNQTFKRRDHMLRHVRERHYEAFVKEKQMEAKKKAELVSEKV